MTDLIISEASQEALRARLASPEGKEALSTLVGLIVEAVLDVMPPDLLETLDTPEGMDAFCAAWPDMVDAFLFRGGDGRARNRAAKRSGKRRSSGAGAD